MKHLCCLIRRLGIHANLYGYHYLIRAVQLTVSDRSVLMDATKRIYPVIAREFQISIASVDRGLRTVLRLLWERGNIAALESFAGYSIRKQPSICEVIDILSAHYISLRKSSALVDAPLF